MTVWLEKDRSLDFNRDKIFSSNEDFPQPVQPTNEEREVEREGNEIQRHEGLTLVNRETVR